MAPEGFILLSNLAVTPEPLQKQSRGTGGQRGFGHHNFGVLPYEASLYTRGNIPLLLDTCPEASAPLITSLPFWLKSADYHLTLILIKFVQIYSFQVLLLKQHLK